jgi:hypothetical protein
MSPDTLRYTTSPFVSQSNVGIQEQPPLPKALQGIPNILKSPMDALNNNTTEYGEGVTKLSNLILKSETPWVYKYDNTRIHRTEVVSQGKFMVEIDNYTNQPIKYNMLVSAASKKNIDAGLFYTDEQMAGFAGKRGLDPSDKTRSYIFDFIIKRDLDTRIITIDQIKNQIKQYDSSLYMNDALISYIKALEIPYKSGRKADLYQKIIE